ncbi:MAG: TIGR03936 family radical SAM-associated protein, partial [candidate division Zixibacteria bacterium]|nr:TIGR03936 family radical SAM-associated protein [candidate division Zixibacteria bacterium]
DAFVIGDGEEIINEILDKYKELKSKKSKKEDTLLALSGISGVYVPSLYEAKYDEDGEFKSLIPNSKDVPKLVKKRIVQDLKNEYYPKAPLVPLIEIVHDRLDLEIMRGCAWKCNFCYACQFYDPLRTREIEDVLLQAEEGISNSGWDEVSLLSLSTTDYPHLDKLVANLNNMLQHRRISISFPSMRPDAFTEELAREILKTRKTGLTFAPEAGTERLRKLINKDIQEEKLLKSIEIAYSSGWNLIKLYFMIGLPTEEEEDLKGIVNLIQKVLNTGRKFGSNRNLNVTISHFLPKPHTPFQREKQAGIQEIEGKIDFLRSHLRNKNLHLKFRNPLVSYLEGILGRGDRKLSNLIFYAWQQGARFDAWNEHFNYQLWERSFQQAGINIESYLTSKDKNEPLAWEHISLQKDKPIVQKPRERSFTAVEERKNEVEKERDVSVTQKEDFGRRKKRKLSSSGLTVARSRVRIRWAKNKEVRFSSHLDVIRMFERAIRRSDIPIAFSEGFHPHLKISFGPPLPLGFVSEAEYLDLQLTEPYSPSIFFALDKALHPGFRLLEARPILGKALSLSSSINSVIYETILEQPFEVVQRKIKELLNKDALLVIRKSKDGDKEIEGRYFIRNLECENLSEATRLKLNLLLGSRGYIRPQEVLGFGLGLEERELSALIIKRVELLIQRDDKTFSPLEIV